MDTNQNDSIVEDNFKLGRSSSLKRQKPNLSPDQDQGDLEFEIEDTEDMVTYLKMFWKEIQKLTSEKNLLKSELKKKSEKLKELEQRVN